MHLTWWGHQYMVGIICPPGWNKVKLAAKTWWGHVPIPTGVPAFAWMGTNTLNSCTWICKSRWKETKSSILTIKPESSGMDHQNFHWYLNPFCWRLLRPDDVTFLKTDWWNSNVKWGVGIFWKAVLVKFAENIFALTKELLYYFAAPLWPLCSTQA